VSKDKEISYKDAGVDIEAADRAKARIRKLVRQTFGSEVLSEIGSFGSLFQLNLAGFKAPVLVSSTDGVGTKLKVAFLTGNHRTVGIDLVNHCVNDILVQGARPLFFMDYLAMGKMKPGVVEHIIEGLAKACKEVDCALIGGETAEMPDFYAPGEYDLAGFIVGIVEKAQIINGSAIKPGDVLLGLASSGLHTNGYSLARKLLFQIKGWTIDTHVDELGRTVGEELLETHRCYWSGLKDLLPDKIIKGLAHITGGGFTGNLPRILPQSCQARIKLGSWPILPIFKLLQKIGNISQKEMYRTFNMGLGMIAVVSPLHKEELIKNISSKGIESYLIGDIVKGERGVVFLKQ
jgi:phosphoribosylformylglycinamidine cyclo-ligase